MPLTDPGAEDYAQGSAQGFFLPPQRDEALEEAPEQGTAELFDVGPTYEDERQLQEQTERQREEALVLQIFETNKRLLEELTQLDRVRV